MTGRSDYAVSVAVLAGDCLFVWGVVSVVRWLWGKRSR